MGMDGFSAGDERTRGDFFTIWRQPTLVAMEVHGPLDDARSEQWRAALESEFTSRGHPRFLAMHISRADPQNSLKVRFQTAEYVRRHLQHLEYAAVLIGGAAGPLVVVRTVLRVVRMRNVRIFNDVGRFNRAVDMMRSGRAPDADLPDVEVL